MAAALAVCLCGCSGGDYISLLKAPSSPEEPRGIAAALNRAVKGEYTLRYPAEGEHRGALTRFDLDGNGATEAVVFYSTRDSDGVVTMHLGLLRREGGDWIMTSDQRASAAGVNFVSFRDIDRDGVWEIVVSWNGGASGTLLAVYSYEGGELVARFLDECLAHFIYDADSDGEEELLVISDKEPGENKPGGGERGVPSAFLYKLDKGGVKLLSSCGVEPSVVEYGEPFLSEVGGFSAVVTDGFLRGGAAVTEAFVWGAGTLRNLFFDEETGKNTATERASGLPSKDINGDGTLEIPRTVALPFPEEAGSTFLVRWECFTPDGFQPSGLSLCNTEDGYIVDIPTDWEGHITVASKDNLRERIVYLWDAERSLTTEELFRVRVFSSDDWENGNRGRWRELLSSGDSVYAGAVTSGVEGYALRFRDLKTGFSLLS